MKRQLIDTNVIIRYLVEAPASISPKFKGVYSFFERLERGDCTVYLPELVLFEAFFVLTRVYKVPQPKAAEKLDAVIRFKGIEMDHKPIMHACLQILQEKKIDLVDAHLLAVAKERSINGIYSFDRDLSKNGLELMDVK